MAQAVNITAMFRVDMPIHSELGGDSIIGPGDLVGIARRQGLDAVCVTEHHSYKLSEPFDEISRRTGFPIFRGMEYSAEEGHVLVYGLPLDRGDLPQQMPMQHVIDWVHERGGVAAPAHPYQKPMRGLCLGDRVLRLQNLYALEAWNGSATMDENSAADRAADVLRCGKLGGSDAHGPVTVGRAYTVFDRAIDTMDDLVAALKSGDYFAGFRTPY